MKKLFQFKQFSLDDSQSAMKLSTDAVLLGAFVSVKKTRYILDVGTGSGIIALMLAQRSNAHILGIDPHEGSIENAKYNFENSPWSGKLKAIKTDLESFSTNEINFDTIVSNPPFFLNSQLSPYKSVNIARHNQTLSFKTLIKKTSQLLTKEGQCNFIIAASSFDNFHRTALNSNLFLTRKMMIFPKKSKTPNRILLEYHKNQPANLIQLELTIRNEDNSYTDEYKSFTQDFYLNF